MRWFKIPVLSMKYFENSRKDYKKELDFYRFLKIFML